jgi:hypothetical protein
LFEVVDALRPRRCIADLLHGWHQEPNQDGDDGDDDEKFDECEASTDLGHGKPFLSFRISPDKVPKCKK